jgi:hypothetical protein
VPCWTDAEQRDTDAASAGGTMALGPVDAGPGGRWAAYADPRGARFRLWQARRHLGARLVNAPDPLELQRPAHGRPGRGPGLLRTAVRLGHRDLAFATLIRHPGYGDHLQATVDPDIRTRQEGVVPPPGFEDAIAWVAPAGRARARSLARLLLGGRPR